MLKVTENNEKEEIPKQNAKCLIPDYRITSINKVYFALYSDMHCEVSGAYKPAVLPKGRCTSSMSSAIKSG
ncbi:MAG: hypothetical protein ACOYEG_07090 [Petrimonas sp.]|jgi:hypothetical protein